VILKQENGILFFQFPNLAKLTGIRHGIFCRNGGSSRHPYHSLNVGLAVGDDSGTVKRNLERIARCIDAKELVFTRQVHDTTIRVFTNSHSIDAETPSSSLPVGDGMITDIQGKFLSIKLADCQSVLMVDPVRKVVANIHSGWRGSIKNIIGKAINKLEEQFQCRPGDIRAGISPSLGPCCAEFVNYRKEIPKRFWGYKDKADRFDFWAISRDQLCDAGVLSKHIDTSGICTRCNTDRFFSYRGEGTTGRFASVIGLSDVHSV
jgi:YfiH family protein